MHKFTLLIISMLFIIHTASAQLNLQRALKAGAQTLQAIKLSDAQIEAYVKDFVRQSDSTNVVCGANDPYAIRLNIIIGKIVNNKALNFKVYKTKDVNAFACADGSIRVYSGLMDLMSDDEVLGVIGHEIGHIMNKDTKDAFRNALINSAVREGLAATDQRVAKLSDSQIGAIGEAFFNSKYSRTQEYEADNYGYEFLKNNGKNPWAMTLSFEKLHQMEQQAGAKSNAIERLFSTHPDILARTKKMAERATKDGYKRPGNSK